MNYPLPLYDGDSVGLIAPSSPILKERLEQCIDAVRSFGLTVTLGESTTKTKNGYLSGPDRIRANDINAMFENPKIKAIFCLRGGYGSTRIVSMLDYNMIQHNPKFFVGYSDITSFHLAFYSLSHLVTFHGPMVSSNMVDDFDCYTCERFFSAIKQPQTLTLQHKNPLDHTLTVISGGIASGRIIGGCLSLVTAAIKTFYEPDYTNTILFLEEINETVPRCDLMFQHLKLCGVFDRVNGVILGSFKDCINPSDPSYTIQDYLTDFFKDYPKPVLYQFPSGHDKPMATIPFGTICTMDTDDCLITFDYC